MGWVCSVPMRCPTLLHYLEPWKNKPRAKIVTKECLPTFFLNFFMLYFQTFNFLCVFAMSLCDLRLMKEFWPSSCLDVGFELPYFFPVLFYCANFS